ncbi:hypothetical protein SNE40_022600 [Patella caerulea]|uniref:Uncharacterized protein n=1 Tax=Patella caerulea TaxID=87958 RepID=A0AAN8IV67_PATCE
MPEIGGYRLFTLLAICLAGVGCLFHVIGLSVVYWIVSDPFVSGVGVGLWKVCILGVCESYPSNIPDYLRATEAFVIIGLLAGLGGLVLSVISLLQKRKTFHMMAGVACFVAAGCILLAIIIFGAETTLTPRTQFGWGFILCIVSTFLFVPAGVLNLLETKNTS